MSGFGKELKSNGGLAEMFNGLTYMNPPKQLDTDNEAEQIDLIAVTFGISFASHNGICLHSKQII